MVQNIVPKLTGLLLLDGSGNVKMKIIAPKGYAMLFAHDIETQIKGLKSKTLADSPTEVDAFYLSKGFGPFNPCTKCGDSLCEFNQVIKEVMVPRLDRPPLPSVNRTPNNLISRLGHGHHATTTAAMATMETMAAMATINQVNKT